MDGFPDETLEEALDRLLDEAGHCSINEETASATHTPPPTPPSATSPTDPPASKRPRVSGPAAPGPSDGSHAVTAGPEQHEADHAAAVDGQDVGPARVRHPHMMDPTPDAVDATTPQG